MKYKHYTFESNIWGLADLLVDFETTQESDFNPGDFISNPDNYDNVTDNGIVEITGGNLPEYLVNQC